MMTFKSKGALVTGGAGFIGSHVVDALVARGIPVKVLDNFSTGDIDNLPDDPLVTVIDGDCRKFEEVVAAMKDVDIVFHFQANADIRGGERNSAIDFEQNTLTTFHVLRAMKLFGVKRMVFASSAAVYGDMTGASSEHSPKTQTSHYGASKLCGEAMIEGHSAYDSDFEYAIFRFVSWIGPRYSHGCIADFVEKLTKDASRLEVLGDGRQTKSCLDVSDGINAIFTVLEKSLEKRGIYNVGHYQTITVREIAETVIDELGEMAVIECLGGDRGWVGDAPFVVLNTRRLCSLGWRPHISITDSIRQTVRCLAAR